MAYRTPEPFTAPTVAERLRSQEDKRAIRGYAAVIDPAFLGLSVATSIRLRINGADRGKFAAKVKQWPEIVRLDRLTGDDSHLALALNYLLVVQVFVRTPVA